MNRIIKCLAFFTVLLVLSYNMAQKKENRPNVILFLADDLGHSDLSCYGSEHVKTLKNWERLLSKGMASV